MHKPAQSRDFQPTVFDDAPFVQARMKPSFRADPLHGMSHANRQAAFPEEPEAANANRMQQRKLALERDTAVFGERSRNAELMRAAYRNGVDAGERSGYIDGMHWGLLRGALAGALLACLLFWAQHALWPLIAGWFA